MPRYFFPMYIGFRIEEDPTGTEFLSIEDAIRDARKAQHDIVCAGVPICRIEITDDQGRLLAAVPRANN